MNLLRCPKSKTELWSMNLFNRYIRSKRGINLHPIKTAKFKEKIYQKKVQNVVQLYPDKVTNFKFIIQ